MLYLFLIKLKGHLLFEFLNNKPSFFFSSNTFIEGLIFFINKELSSEIGQRVVYYKNINEKQISSNWQLFTIFVYIRM
jgi:hypothetical protein